MKIFAFIMAIIVLTLSVMPCMDGSLVNSGIVKTEISKNKNQEQHSDRDDCSPFCTCSCCSGTVFFHTLAVNYLDKPIFLAKIYSDYKPSFYSDISLSIWQPPKLV